MYTHTLSLSLIEGVQAHREGQRLEDTFNV